MIATGDASSAIIVAAENAMSRMCPLAPTSVATIAATPAADRITHATCCTTRGAAVTRKTTATVMRVTRKAHGFGFGATLRGAQRIRDDDQRGDDRIPGCPAEEQIGAPLLDAGPRCPCGGAHRPGSPEPIVGSRPEARAARSAA